MLERPLDPRRLPWRAGAARPIRTGLLTALAAPGAADDPAVAIYPVPLFGLTFQPTDQQWRRDRGRLRTTASPGASSRRYAPNDDSSLYAIYARGRRPEVLSALTPGRAVRRRPLHQVDAETVDSFEVGARHSLIDRKLYLDGALFYYHYDNFQTLEQDGTLFVTTNAGKADSLRLRGARSAGARAATLTLFANYAYNHSRFKTGVLDGNRFRLSPDHSLLAGRGRSAPTSAPAGSISRRA